MSYSAFVYTAGVHVAKSSHIHSMGINSASIVMPTMGGSEGKKK